MLTLLFLEVNFDISGGYFDVGGVLNFFYLEELMFD